MIAARPHQQAASNPVSGIDYTIKASSESHTQNPIIFLHGIGADARSFHHQFDGIENHTLIAWNMPGYGKSRVDMSPPTFKHLSDRLAAFLEALDIESAHLVGHSIGGMLAIEHCVRQPDQVASLVLAGTTPRFGSLDNSFKDAFLSARLSPLDQGKTMAELAPATAKAIVGSQTPHPEIRHIETVFSDIPEQTWRDILDCLVTFNRTDDLSQIRVPTLVVAGAEDTSAPMKTMSKMASRIQNAGFEVIENAGHMLHQEHPKAFNSLVTTFLSEHKFTHV